ncbi:dehydrase and lipid transport-domain-containing protein [Podospora appendiculata]|uniref:Dehydrase and lipid transport-domain-containing protein n=1 Tax=Podospora appendiculata TaxID=314037 RepID=A0AAE0X569_9PEZI|nr:dehydrase and lipid transport-domain-containing protein [Podospora appendiculata]
MAPRTTAATAARRIITVHTTPCPYTRSHLTFRSSTSPSKPTPATTPRRHSSSWLLSALPNLSSGPSAPQTIHARRTLPYPPSQIYSLIANIDSYSSFLPHCASSTVTGWTSPPPAHSHQPLDASSSNNNNKRWPARADLTVGWGPFTESYTSRVYCVPGSIVEAVSGAARTSIPASTLSHVGYNLAAEGAVRPGEGLFESLVTRWTVQPVAATTRPTLSVSSNALAGIDKTEESWTEVELVVRFQFANPLLGHAVGQLAKEKVDAIVQAFEDRARTMYGRRKSSSL